MMFIRTLFIATVLHQFAHFILPGFSASAEEMDIEARTVITESSDGVPIAVTISGNPRGNEILLIHNYLASTINWKKQLHSDLAKTHKIVAVDLRGHGSSGKPWDEATYIDTKFFADDIAAAIDAAELKKPVLVAWSYGGLFLMDYIRHYGTENVAGIVLASSNGGLKPAPPKSDPTPEYQARIERSRSANIFVISRWTKEFIDYMGADTEQSGKDMEQLRLSAMLTPHFVRRFLRERPIENLDIVDDINVPVLFVAGENDSAAKSGDINSAAEKLSDTEIKTYENLGSMIHWHAPERFNKDLAVFVERVQ